MYYKGGNMIHTIRQVINDDEKFRKLLIDLNKTFYHKTVTGAEVEKFISEQSGIDFSKVFSQYLRTIMIPAFEYKISGRKLSYRWTNVVNGFNMPVKVLLGEERWLKPTTEWQHVTLKDRNITDVKADRNFYVEVKKAM